MTLTIIKQLVSLGTGAVIVQRKPPAKLGVQKALAMSRKTKPPMIE